MKKLLQGVGLAEVGVVDRQNMLLACSGNHFQGTVIVDRRDLPILVNHIVVMLAVFEGIDLLGPRARRYRAFGLVINYWITDSKLGHYALLSCRYKFRA